LGGHPRGFPLEFISMFSRIIWICRLKVKLCGFNYFGAGFGHGETQCYGGGDGDDNDDDDFR